MDNLDNPSPAPEARNGEERNEAAVDFDPNVVIFACRH
jgi:hypothetical protein